MVFGVEGVKWEGRVYARLLSLLDYSRQLRPEPWGSAAKCKGQLSKWLGTEGRSSKGGGESPAGVGTPLCGPAQGEVAVEAE